MRWAILLFLLAAIGCATSHDVEISARPADATISIDGAARGRAPIKETFKFSNDSDVHTVTATRLGYKDQSLQIGRDFDKDSVTIEMRPRTKRVTFTVTPVPGTITVDGKPISSDPVSQITRELEFTVDSRNQWTSHVARAERPNYKKAEVKINWADSSPDYILALDSVRKDLSITTTPPGAQVFLNGESLGISPISYSGYPFPVNADTNEYVPQKLKVVKAGYDPVETSIGWDGGKNDYHVELLPHAKVVHITSNPPGAEVKIAGAVVMRDAQGASTASLVFPPIDDKGTLKTYAAVATKAPTDISQWFPLQFQIRWEEGATDYPIKLKEIKTRPVALLRMRPVHDEQGWQLTPEIVGTICMKDTGEGPGSPKPVKITDLPRGTFIDTLTVSPDGSMVLFTTLTGKTAADLRSTMMTVHADGSGGVTSFGDGKTLDLTPCFTPDGNQIVFASNRGGRRLSVWEMSAIGDPGMTQLTNYEENVLWPVVDSDPKPRLFWEALIDTRTEPRLFMTQLGANSRMELTRGGGMQPRVSPKADSILYTAINEKSGKRQILRVPDGGGVPSLLTSATDADEHDPVWSRDGNRIAYVSDQGTDEDGTHNDDIWALDVEHPDRPVRITVNGSVDDCPAWDPGGRAIFFRSNRGGEWAIWRIAVK